MPPAPAFCPTCGETLQEREIEGRRRRFCPACDRPVYRNPIPAAGVLVVREDPRGVLLIRRGHPPATGQWSLPAGFLEWDEHPKIGAVRELREETSVAVGTESVGLFDTQLVAGARGGTVLVIVYTAPAAATTGTPAPGSDAEGAQYVSSAELDGIPIEPGYHSVFERALATAGRESAQGSGGSPS